MATVTLNKQQLVIAQMCTPDPDDYLPDTATRFAVRMGITAHQATVYCEVGLFLQRFPRVAEQLWIGAFSWQLVRKIHDDLAAVSDEHVEEVDAAAAEALKPTRENQAIPARYTVHYKLKKLVRKLDAAAEPLDEGEQPRGTPALDPSEKPVLDIDRRADDHITFRVMLPMLDGVELEKILNNVAAKEKCTLGEALMKVVRGQASAEVVLNLYRNVAHEGEELFAEGSWLSEMASEEWMAKVTHLAAPGYAENNGYAAGADITSAVVGRDGTCRAPGCTQPAYRCDKDHVQRYDHDNPEEGGPTSSANMHLLCRFHHKQKTAGVWDVELHSDGTEVWTSHGDGHTVITTPNGPLGRETFKHRAVRKARVVRRHNEDLGEGRGRKGKGDSDENR
ncbi:MAG TPA: HNH endonuclease [Candidatus Corynebacterium gallistercoris]|uniref:HNH endonuclease n=1 Tax=Candidatus Corynebacterium gallistercoris TaxID=2838530 RepID=A0A9D1RY43_9CORY|nr:HNH endonuclease [Candidatus Corynebacterium gallistercoris]